MATGKFVAAIVFLLASVTSSGQPSRSNDGCAVLGELVQNGVQRAATQFEVNAARNRAGLSGRRSWGGLAHTRRQVCGNTTEAATRAFSQALAGLNMQVKWNGPMNPGDYCLRSDLSQCYPGPEPGVPTLPPNRLAFVHGAWKGVRNAVASQMPFGTVSGISSFTAASLDAALSSYLSASVDGLLGSSQSPRRRTIKRIPGIL